jgi:hypothetical protein
MCSLLLDHNTTTYLKLSGTAYFSDSCPGQNRNHIVVRLLATLAVNGRFERNRMNKKTGLKTKMMVRNVNMIGKVYSLEHTDIP